MNQKDKLEEAVINALKENKLDEGYSDKLGGDPQDFISDVNEIKQVLTSLDVTKFGSHLAQQMVEEFIDTCDTQMNMTKQKYNLED